MKEKVQTLSLFQTLYLEIHKLNHLSETLRTAPRRLAVLPTLGKSCPS
jgi:hypothetical protein